MRFYLKKGQKTSVQCFEKELITEFSKTATLQKCAGSYDTGAQTVYLS